MVQLAYITGWRIPSEVLRLQWRHVDFEARVLRLDPHTTKNDEGRTFRVECYNIVSECDLVEAAKKLNVLQRALPPEGGSPARKPRRLG